ncbi:hypothetical protein MY9_3397 [Bacillus sp. JS]|nr:hypothetical protein MY9_3397 [Bacillus sp. JS]
MKNRRYAGFCFSLTLSWKTTYNRCNYYMSICSYMYNKSMLIDTL